MKNLKQKTVNKILLNGSFEPKPASFKEVKTDLYTGYNAFISELLETMPVFTIEQLGIKRPIDFFKVKNINVPVLFILETPQSKYLINTAGFNYCRYVMLID